ncbi:copper homeostasis protein CutC [Pacificibacter marinus]|uniref:PF03932 family protein CutC n=1 Tax=Pacificibacter marinus TaxID=658057 RepID=A0A1Y5R7A1_9RHOB|nr:copper homeostasis protein CutC [Pacificibacter marinus]SEK28885.1 copper homeostasis protein [Pacificibacter marinus]SLN10787.1 Copper homeostasis protein CutC [Pacificibacter marinus]
MITLEVCVDSLAGIFAATKGGADRIELCSALGLGGLTPSAGLIKIASEAPLPAMAMIRPRAGDFVWTRDERAALVAEIHAVRDAGLAGVVIGASLPNGELDGETLQELMQAAIGLDVTLHRAIDLTPDVDAALQICRDLGIKRVLSSGGAKTAMAGLERLVQMATHTISVMPGGGVTAENVADLAARLPLSEVHASCSVVAPIPQNSKIAEFGFQPSGARATDTNSVIALRKALDQIVAARTSG